ncbi:hypothetical protein PoB_001081900 [Plakobranchus ocellatus]|uniref:Uncharacterized protein n=1 Tax=Plakobranchus ocellatus TaxID=259542 RepID=A0AAV3YMS6_9GAST|nr:hypothetical protein PoB_001081900 [Plakobranchus ocellatus]
MHASNERARVHHPPVVNTGVQALFTYLGDAIKETAGQAMAQAVVLTSSGHLEPVHNRVIPGFQALRHVRSRGLSPQQKSPCRSQSGFTINYANIIPKTEKIVKEYHD